VPNLGVIIRPQYIYTLILLFSFVFSQLASDKSKQYSPLTKKVYSFSKLDFVTSEGEFNETICTISIPDFKEDSPPFVAIYYKRDNSNWFTESLYRKRLRFSFQDGIIKLDQSNFWDWFEITEIKIVIIY